MRHSIISLLNSEFVMKGLRPLNFFLGIAVTCHPKGLFLSQKKYVEEIIVCARTLSCKPCLTSVDIKPKISSTDSTLYEDLSLYYSLASTF